MSKTNSDNDAEFPQHIFVAATHTNKPLADVATEVAAQLTQAFAHFPLAGKRVAVAAGSRGIARIAAVVKASVETLRSLGAAPFIFPAMGSHGGATAAGQHEVLATFGITEAAMNAPIEAAMETVELGRTARGTPVFAARTALAADALLFINRIKPHTDFVSANFGSGLRKMSVIGLGKADGAFATHRGIASCDYETILTEVSEFALSCTPPTFGLALVEDGCHQLALIEAMPSAAFGAREPVLLALAKAWMPRLPFEQIDVLVIDEMGKDISGAGMDPNVIGRGSYGLPFGDKPAQVKAIYVRGLTAETHGNAIGVGMADVVSQRLVNEIDAVSTYTNALAAMSPESVRIPMHFANDRECLRAALRIVGADPAQARIVRVRNTLALDRFVASAGYAAEVAERADLQLLQGPLALEFSAGGDFAATL